MSSEQTIVLTGGTGGIGFQSALGLAKTGARVVVTGRNRERGEAARAQIVEETGNASVELVVGDVSSIAGIDALADALLARLEHIDVLVNNAGYLGNEPATSADELEMHFAVNVLAPRRLTLRLLPALGASGRARVLNVTGGDAPAAIDVDNLQATSTSVNSTIRAQFADVSDRYPGVSVVYGGEFQETSQTMEQMWEAFFLALIAIFAILAAQFRSYLQPLVVMCVIALAWIGVVLGMTLGGYSLSMYVVYAMVGLAGIVVNDSLILIDFVNKQREAGKPVLEAVRIAASRRFRAILLTTVTTVAGLFPMAAGISGASPVFGPFAAAIVAGLCVASVLTLFVVPSLYLALEDLRLRFLRWSQPDAHTIPVAGGR